MVCARRAGDTPSSSCSPAAVVWPGRRASPSDRPTRATVPDVSPPSEKPPVALGRGLALSVAWERLLGRQDLEHPRTTHRPHALQGRPAVGHLHLLGVGDLSLGLALHTVPLIRSHRRLSGLRHCVPPFGGRGRGAGCMAWWSGAAPPGSPPRDGDNMIRCAQIVGAEAAGEASEKPFRL